MNPKLVWSSTSSYLQKDRTITFLLLFFVITVGAGLIFENAYADMTISSPLALQNLPSNISSEAYSINSAGQIVGDSFFSPFTTHATYWSSPTALPKDLSTLSGYSFSIAHSINSAGQIVGDSYNYQGNYHATYWSSPTALPKDLSTLSGYSFTTALSINSVGQIVGYGTNSSGDSHALYWSSPTALPKVLSTLPGNYTTTALSINSVGQIVGYGTNSLGYSRALYWSSPTALPKDLSILLDSSFSVAQSISFLGQIVGYNINSGNDRALYWSSPTALPQYMGTPPGNFSSDALSINSAGQIVGFGFDLSGKSHAFYWSCGTTVGQDLGTLPDGSNSFAYAINSAGQIVGNSFDLSGRYHALYWQVNDSSHCTKTEVSPNPSDVGLESSIIFAGKVKDTSTGADVPSGSTLTWSDGGAGGTFSNGTMTTNTCALSSFNSSLNCKIKYTPPLTASVGTVITINATFSGQPGYDSSFGTSKLTVLRATTTVIYPSSATITHGTMQTFNATVTDTSLGAKSSPTGTVSWTGSKFGGVFNSGSCTLIPINKSQSNCSVKYTASSKSGPSYIAVLYGGDSIHGKSSVISTVTIK